MPCPARFGPEVKALMEDMAESYKQYPPKQHAAALVRHHKDLLAVLQQEKPPGEILWPCTSPIQAKLLLGSEVVAPIKKAVDAATNCDFQRRILVARNSNEIFNALSEKQRAAVIARFASLRPELEQLKDAL